ncbi:hypothetical protein HRAG_02098 [Helicobacter bilis ATCC 43879]|uniref:Outer membrane protein beta-barrel domain-containing protein n=2 Tax=Helicobacteraceae TaxID=72293 RepID=C3XJ52_9HELI|nr:hypothetical protein HRAG_02098 [Helicobacter bilis ATCC 43879]
MGILCLFGCCVAKEFSQDSDYLIGVHARVGASMGVGIEFGMPIIKSGVVEWRNFIGAESFGMKLASTQYDTATLLFSDKMTLSYLTGSSVATAIGISYFRPYLFLSGGFGLTGGKYNSFGTSPYYGEVSAGIGHEFITKNGHTFFFEFGGGAMFIDKVVANQTLTTQGTTKVLVGYRFYYSR